MQIKCRNNHCNRLIADVTDIAMLPNTLECQHCHHVNIIRRRPTRKKVKPALVKVPAAPAPEEKTPEAEDLSKAASTDLQGAIRDDSPGPGETSEEG